MPSPIVIAALLRIFGAGNVQESATLVQAARELLVSGQASKAMVLLRRARALDSVQAEVDRLQARCQAQLGEWVPVQATSDWMPGDDRIAVAVRERPDSMFKAAQAFLAAENLGEAGRIGTALALSHAADPAWIKFQLDVRARQDAKVAYHSDLAKKAQGRGDPTETANQWRLAWSARPEDPVLRDMSARSEQVRLSGIRAYRSGLFSALAAKDEGAALDLARKARISFPGVAPFQKVFDSLDTLRSVVRNDRLDQINALADQGRDQEAADAMEALLEGDPQDPVLSQAQSVLQVRIQKRRRKALSLEAARTCDAAVTAGDLPKALDAYAELKKYGLEGSEFDRIQQRVDSLRVAVHANEAYEEALGAARNALRSGDLLEAKSYLQKAGTLQPGSMVVKALMASLLTYRSTSSVQVAAAGGPVTRGRDADRAKELLLEGVAAYRSGEYGKATEKWTQVLALDSSCVQARKYLANVGLKQKRLR
jgi:tetratricopeptide (TPR) repeat protein